ncbi:MAG: RNA 2',3'-cyclic phosphodiesterase [Candidatus Bathyarchaeota archaeon]|nr:RNA 2',3'-cyclic phosphodiesterase [Candidatus Bathyarchaeota archaeon]MDW8041133.1 RNA 2',3'-cyclic phosphodiesterase [Nitrososphaerota archaeon]
MSETIRSFIAFDIEDSGVLENITKMQKILSGTGADLKLVEPQNIHITLRFLGNITQPMVDKVYGGMCKVHFTPFTIKIQGLGAFPNQRNPRVVWAGIREGFLQLRGIFEQLEPFLRSLGFAPDPKGFSPHLTIARVRSGRNKAQLVKCLMENVNFEFGVVKANCLRLKRSDLTPKGPIYTTLREHCPKS